MPGVQKKTSLRRVPPEPLKVQVLLQCFQRMANRQGEAEWFKDLLKAYGSHDQAVLEKAKIKFSLTSYRESVQAQAGTRLEGRKR